DYLGGSRIGEPCARKLVYEVTRTPPDPGREIEGRALRIFAAAMAGALLPVLAMVAGISQAGEVEGLLRRHAVSLVASPLRRPGQALGLPFSGLPGLSLATIRRNRAIVQAARSLIAASRDLSSQRGPQTTFDHVCAHLPEPLREAVSRPPQPLAFAESRDAPWLDWQARRPFASGVLRVASDIRQFLLLAIGLPYALAVGFLLASGTGLVASLSAALAPALLIAVMLAGLLVALLRRDELANRPRDATPAPHHVAAMMERENAPGHVQNHMISITRLRRAGIRRLSLPLAFQAIAAMARLGFMRAGFLATIGTIHAARWVVPPGTRQLIFVSNYGGSWESYLEDFITKSAAGVTGVWSNTEGFPKARLLFLDGAEDGDRMKRFARGSMQPTPFWFSACPDLSTAAIRKHALIVSGLHCAKRLSRSPSDAQAWLDLFSTVPRPGHALQYGEIQTLMFGGLRRHPHSRLLGLRFGPPAAPDGAAGHPYAHAQAWLTDLLRDGTIAFGDKPAEGFVGALAFSPAGLARLGLDRELGRTADPLRNRDQACNGFPGAFALGMTHPSRQRVLNDPAELGWTDETVDAVLLLYAREPADAACFEAEAERARSFGLHPDLSIDTGLLRFPLEAWKAAWHDRDGKAFEADGAASRAVDPQADAELSMEPFGFVDGISQPLVRGFPGRHGGPDPVHAVEPGEFILGYADNRGYFPPSPLIERDMAALGMAPDDILPSPVELQPTQYPAFAAAAAPVRDFGRNGSYLAIRQLAQDADGFRQQIADQAQAIASREDSATPWPRHGHRTEEWLAAKLLGRWRDGSSLVDHPFKPAFRDGEEAVAANGFLYRDADPQGLRCPFGAHVRRTFPRDSLAPDDDLELSVSNRHRLLRRGRPYFDAGGKPAGTLFMCFNADIERQFEFVQQTWLGSPTFHGLENEADPMMVHHDATGPGHANARISLPGRNAPLVLDGMQSYVTLQGGGYFFMPGRRALWFLAGAAFLNDGLGEEALIPG
ncbi:MAG TPA: hypothetical protein PKD92_09645, partial [Novosphingobium sp.]|nr:hypothetical protein [Novosphingobium sp.]